MRMWSIYPTQVQAIVDAMKPDFTELEAAQNILIKAQDAEWDQSNMMESYTIELHTDIFGNWFKEQNSQELNY